MLGYCPFHQSEDIDGTKLDDGSWSFTCERKDHPGHEPWRWLHTPEPPAVAGLSGLADELDLATRLPEVIGSLGPGWCEYGLVEREYAAQDPEGFARMVAQWGHTAIADTRYSASAYLAGSLGRLSSSGAIAYHPGRGSGRWSYNSDISWWAAVPPPEWDERTAWVDVLNDHGVIAGSSNDPCRDYVPLG